MDADFFMGDYFDQLRLTEDSAANRLSFFIASVSTTSKKVCNHEQITSSFVSVLFKKRLCMCINIIILL